jgi:hypothetical protein
MPIGPSVFLRAESVVGQTEQHRDARGAHADMPVNLLAEVAGNQLTEESADVDSHIEDRESGVPACAAFRIQVADNRGDVRLEQARPADDENQSEEERNLAGALTEQPGQADADVSRRDQAGADENRAAQSQQTVGNPPARK